MAPPRDDLRLLSIFHYVLAGFSGLFAFVPLIWLGMGAFFLLGAFEPEAHPPPPFIGWFMLGLGILGFLLGVAYVVALVLAGRFLARQRHWLYCMVIAGFSCASFPLGTALGVFTLVTLSKPEVKAEFGVRS